MIRWLLVLVSFCLASCASVTRIMQTEAENAAERQEIKLVLLEWLWTKDPNAQLTNVRWGRPMAAEEFRVTADYLSCSDTGTYTFWVDRRLDGSPRSIRMIAEEALIPEKAATFAAPVAQITDKGTASVLVATGRGVELNPILAVLSPAGMFAVGLGMAAVSEYAVHVSPVTECVASQKLYSATGWGALGVLGGPVGVVLGAALGWVLPGKNDCTNGAVQITSLSRNGEGQGDTPVCRLL